ncbi:MAG: hypothetical protein M3R45_09845 [Pseudomonadota bacterium]|nr:hypothetical protein [Pseudomonadota bacterium]
MQKLSFLAALLCGLTCAQAAGVSSPSPAPQPLTGKWTWTLPGKACSETWHYRADGTRNTSSGEETLQSRYEVSALPSLLGFYRVTETITESNSKPDCSGDLHEADGQPVTRFIQFSPRHDQLIVCKEESLKACFGPLKRVGD